MHLVKAMHMAHGGKPYFSPRVPPFRPCVVERPAARNADSLRLEALASSPPRAVRRRLSARCHSAAQNIFCAVAAPLCSDSLPRPLRARHRRASPRVLENAQGCSAPSSAPCVLEIPGAHGSHCPLCPSSVQVRTSPYKSVFPCPQYRHCAMCAASQQSAVPV